MSAWWAILRAFLSSADFFYKLTVTKTNCLWTLSECQTVWTQIRIDGSVGADLNPNRLKCYQPVTLVGTELRASLTKGALNVHYIPVEFK